MGQIIPYFYADLIARVVPGSVLLALIRLTVLALPQPWVQFISGLGNAQAVVVPIVYAGLAYALGTVLEALSSSILEPLYVFAFARASKKYTPTYPVTSEFSEEDVRSAKELARASFGHLIVSSSDEEKQVVPHIIRFHSEAKMCFAVVLIFAAFIALTIAHKCWDVRIIKDIQNAGAWLSLMVFTTLALLYATYQRLKSRAWFILRAIERLGAAETPETLTKLRDELLAFRDMKNKPKNKDLQRLHKDRS